MTLMSRFSRDRRIERKAYRWVLKMLDDPIRHAERLERWLTLDEDHRAVYKRAAIEMGLARDSAAASPKMRSVLADIHRRAPKRSGMTWLAVSAPMAAAVIVAIFAWHWSMSDPQPSVAGREVRQLLKAPDGPRSYALADNSKVTMISNSVLLVHFSRSERAVDLNSGRARFEVQHDPTRPFTVYIRGGTVTAVGTVFEVDATSSKPMVHLISGKVIVTIAAQTPNQRPRVLTLTSGQKIELTHPEISSQSSAPQGAKVVNTETFDDVPLRDIVIRANAMSSVKIVVPDQNVGAELIFAELNLSDIRSVARKLAATIGGKVDEREPGLLKILKTT